MTGSFLFGPAAAMAQEEQAREGFTFQYAPKVVCGLQRDPENMRLARGFYATAINIHNPNDVVAVFSKTLALTFPPEEQRPGEVMRISRDSLRTHEALEVDCVDIQRRLFPQGFPQAYIKGFVLVRSNASLDVTAVYSTANAEGERDHSSIDVEHVPERIVARRGLPDLIPVPDADNNFCIREESALTVTVKNQGTGPAGASKTEVNFFGGGIVTKDTPALGPGDSTPIQFDIPRGCFVPDCHITITVDRQAQVTESIENNNVGQDTCIG